MHLITSLARAYVYHGDWVADCPRDGCGNVEFLFDQVSPGGPRALRKGQFYCTYCKLIGEIEWPQQMEEIIGILMVRPIPHTRNWYPAEHPTALKFRIENGQSLADLRDENAEHGVE